MTDIDKAARGAAMMLAVVVATIGYAVADAWQAHLDALTAADMAAAEIEYQQSGAAQKAEALVIWEMAKEGRCAPSVPQAAAIPCPTKGGPYWRPPVQADHVWTVGPPVRRRTTKEVSR